MKPHNIREKMIEFIEMADDDFVERLFNDEAFFENHSRIEVLYKNHLLETGGKLGYLQLNSLSKERTTNIVMATPSARVKGEWQRTIFVNETPMSHRDYETMEELVTENIGEWFRNALWIEESLSQ